jgi:hypothetical protein
MTKSVPLRLETAEVVAASSGDSVSVFILNVTVASNIH